MPFTEIPGHADVSDMIGEVFAARRTVLPKWLMAPGPDDRQWPVLLQAAAAAAAH